MLGPRYRSHGATEGEPALSQIEEGLTSRTVSHLVSHIIGSSVRCRSPRQASCSLTSSTTAVLAMHPSDLIERAFKTESPFVELVGALADSWRPEADTLCCATDPHRHRSESIDVGFRKSTVYAIEAGDVQVMLHCSLGMDDGEYYLVVTPLLIPTDAARSTKGFGFFVSLKHRLRRFKLILDNHRWSGMPFSRPRSSPVRHHQPRSAHPNR